MIVLCLLTYWCNAQEAEYLSFCKEEVVENPKIKPEYCFGRKALMKELEEYALLPLSKKVSDYTVWVQLVVCSDGTFKIASTHAENIRYNSLIVESRRIIS